jgi:hypothetical protein
MVVIKCMTTLGTCGTWVVIELIFALPPTTMGVPVILNDFIECNGGSSDPMWMSKQLYAKATLRLKK